MKTSPALNASDLASELARVRGEYAELERGYAELKRQLDWFKQQLFGAKSERRLVDDSGHTLDLFAGAATEAPPSPAPTETVTYERRPKGAKDRSNAVTDEGLRFDATVPVETIDVPAPELAGADADAYEVIDYTDTHRLAQRPGSYVVLRYRTPVLRHTGEDREAAAVINPPAPAGVFAGSLADVSFLAGMLVDKFCYHQPLYRQHQRLADAGIALARATLTNLTGRAIELLEPIAAAQHAHILQGAVLAMDETPIKAGRTKGAGEKPAKMAQGWYWPIYGEADEVGFTFAPHRATRQVHEQLAGFTGTLISDGYSAYTRFAKATDGVTHAQCWSHTRRQFLKAEGSEPEAVGYALTAIRALYRIEAELGEQKLAPDKALAERARQAGPIVDAFFGWVYEQRQRVDLLPKDPLTKALAYTHEREAALRVFLSDPAVPLDTNHLERALRSIPMGRRNWLFCWTEVGAHQVGTIQSLLTTCRLQGVNPYTYLVDVLQRVSQHPAKRVVELTPRVWKEHFADNPLLSDLGA